jgi:hypothetical protein
MDVRQFRQLREGHSVLVAELSNCLPKNDLFALVLRVHHMILDYYPCANNLLGAKPRVNRGQCILPYPPDRCDVVVEDGWLQYEITTGEEKLASAN